MGLYLLWTLAWWDTPPIPITYLLTYRVAAVLLAVEVGLYLHTLSEVLALRLERNSTPCSL